jgi:hypothetical protein
MNFEIISEITEIETMFVGSKIRDLARLKKMYGKGRWRKVRVLHRFACEAVEYGWRNCTGMRPTESVGRKSNVSFIWISL